MKNCDYLDQSLHYDRDFESDYFGFKILERRYIPRVYGFQLNNHNTNENPGHYNVSSGKYIFYTNNIKSNDRNNEDTDFVDCKTRFKSRDLNFLYDLEGSLQQKVESEKSRNNQMFIQNVTSLMKITY